MTLGERLRYAREKANLTGVQVSQKTGIGESSLSEFEHDKREPKLNQLQTLAKLYWRSLAFFFSEESIPQEVVLWRQRPTDAPEDMENAFLRWCEQYHNLEIWCNEKPSGRMPDFKADGESYDYAQAERLAADVRAVLRLGDRPGHELLRVLEEVCGVKVFHKEFEPSGPAASTRSTTFGPAILLNSGNVRWRRNHDLAHELFHLLTWSVFRSGTKAVSAIATEREEKWATCFASNLLMPPEETRRAVDLRSRDGKISMESLFDIARQFDVSVESLLWRIHILYGLGRDKKEATQSEIKRADELASVLEKRENTMPPKWPDRYRALAVKALRRGEISIGRFAEYLQIGRQEAMKYIEQEKPESEEIQIAPA